MGKSQPEFILFCYERTHPTLFCMVLFDGLKTFFNEKKCKKKQKKKKNGKLISTTVHWISCLVRKINKPM